MGVLGFRMLGSRVWGFRSFCLVCLGCRESGFESDQGLGFQGCTV